MNVHLPVPAIVLYQYYSDWVWWRTRIRPLAGPKTSDQLRSHLKKGVLCSPSRTVGAHLGSKVMGMSLETAPGLRNWVHMCKMLVLNPNMSDPEVLDQQFGPYANINNHLFTDFSIRCRCTPAYSMLNVKESELRSVWRRLLMIYHESAPGFDVRPWDRPPPTPRGHMTSPSYNKAGFDHCAVCAPPSSVSAWRPAPPSWPWGWCLSVSSFIPPCGPPLAPSKSRMTALVSSPPL